MSEQLNSSDEPLKRRHDYDQTTEKSVEDLRAILNLLDIPPMPLGDGTFYQAGASEVYGTPYLNASFSLIDKPRPRGGSTEETIENSRVAHWVKIHSPSSNSSDPTV